jgi:integrase
LAVELAKSVRPVAISPWLFCNRRGEETKVKEHFTEHDLRAKCASDAESHAQALLAHADGEVTQPITVENRSA